MAWNDSKGKVCDDSKTKDAACNDSKAMTCDDSKEVTCNDIACNNQAGNSDHADYFSHALWTVNLQPIPNSNTDQGMPRIDMSFMFNLAQESSLKMLKMYMKLKLFLLMLLTNLRVQKGKKPNLFLMVFKRFVASLVFTEL